MLSKKQLQDIANCENIKCKDCSVAGDCKYDGTTASDAAETALAYRDMLEELTKNIQDLLDYSVTGDESVFKETGDKVLESLHKVQKLLKESEG